MNNPTVAALQLYTPGVYNVVVDLLLSAVLFGILTVLSIVSAGHLISDRDIKKTSTALIFSSILILYVSTALHFGAVVSYSVGYCRFLNDTVSALSSGSSESIQVEAVTYFRRVEGTSSYIISFALVTNIVVGDAIVWWRACVLWRRKSVIAAGIVLQATALVLGIVSVTHQSTHIDVDNQLLLRFANVYGVASGCETFLTNMIATLLIGWKAWEHRKVLRLAIVGSDGRALNRRWITPSMRVLILLFESGMIYSGFLGVAVAYNGVKRLGPVPPSSVEFASVVNEYLPGCFAPILAIYPTIIIFIVAINKSPIDGAGGLANGSPSDIPTGILPHITFRGSLSGTHTSPSRAAESWQCPQSEHTTSDSIVNDFTEERRSQEDGGYGS